MTAPPKKPFAPMGPYAPPNPSEVESSSPEPMAVANDKRTPHDAFMPTTASMDAFDPEVAARYRAHPRRSMTTKTREENRAAEAPPGYTEPDEQGFRRLKADDR